MEEKRRVQHASLTKPLCIRSESDNDAFSIIVLKLTRSVPSDKLLHSEKDIFPSVARPPNKKLATNILTISNGPIEKYRTISQRRTIFYDFVVTETLK